MALTAFPAYTFWGVTLLLLSDEFPLPDTLDTLLLPDPQLFIAIPCFFY